MNGNIQLDSVESCKSIKTEVSDKTIFDYLSAIIANQSEPKTKSSLEYKIELIENKKKVKYWKVELTFMNLDEESGDPWNPAFRFLINQQTKKMVRSSLECIGT